MGSRRDRPKRPDPRRVVFRVAAVSQFAEAAIEPTLLAADSTRTQVDMRLEGLRSEQFGLAERGDRPQGERQRQDRCSAGTGHASIVPLSGLAYATVVNIWKSMKAAEMAVSEGRMVHAARLYSGCGHTGTLRFRRAAASSADDRQHGG